MPQKGLIATISIATILFLSLCAVTFAVVQNDNLPFPIDTTIANWAYEIRGEKGGFTYWFFRIITELGYTYFTVGILVLIAVLLKFKPKAFFIAIPVAVAWALHKLLKLLVQRPRPDFAMWWMTEGSSSFPSGHTNTATCLFVLIIFFVITSQSFKPWLKCLLASLSFIAIILVSLSRIILGVHFFTDVVGGILLGAFCATTSILIYQIIKYKKQKHIQSEIETAKTNAKKS